MISKKDAEGFLKSKADLLEQIVKSELEDSFVQKYKNRYNESPEMYATASYFIIYTIAELAKNCGDHCELKDLSNFQLTVAGKDIQFDKDRTLITPIYIKTVRDGKFVFLE
jgi:ABC-type branched-subunit amino acid transport system substrate-binding protein